MGKHLYTQLLQAADEGRVDAIVAIVNQGVHPSNGFFRKKRPNTWTPLVYAIGNGHIGATEALLILGADVNADDGDALCFAVARGHFWAVELLLKFGANPRARGGEILRKAVEKGNPHIIGLLRHRTASPRM